MSNKAPSRLYKFGKTNSVDVLDRFDLEKHSNLKWRGIPLSRDYEVGVLWSHWVPKYEAIEAERWFKESFPKEFFCEEDYNGITECRDWEPKRSFAFSTELRKRYPVTKEYRAEIDSLMKESTLLKTHSKIYFVMLTKK